MKTLARRVPYFGYYLKQLDWQRLRKFMAYVQKEKGWSRAGQWRRIIRDSLRFNVSILEYYQFRFFELSDAEKATWAGTGTMYEFQRRANPPENRALLEDKRRFHEAYRKYFRHEVCTLEELEQDPALAARLLEQHGDLVFKPASGNCGVGIAFVESRTLSADGLVSWMRSRNFDLVESRVAQHPALQTLSPSGVNTVRIFTCLDKRDRCQILGCRLRISVNSPVDNMAAGNLAAPVEEETGRVYGAGVYTDRDNRNPGGAESEYLFNAMVGLSLDELVGKGNKLLLQGVYLGSDDAGGKVGSKFDDVFTVAGHFASGAFDFRAEYLLGDNPGGDIKGWYVMPSFKLTDKVQLVGRFEQAESDKARGIRAPSRYVRDVPSVKVRETKDAADEVVSKVDPQAGDDYQSLYLGLNYYLSGHGHKLMFGVEMAELKNTDAGTLESTTVTAAWRMLF